MTRYIDPIEQLVVEIFVRDIAHSIEFYQQLGFELLDHRESFAVLAWEGSQLFLDERPDVLPSTRPPQANIRIMVPDVDRYWTQAQAMGVPVLASIEDRPYGLRDFTILDPDGFGVRFGTRLQSVVVQHDNHVVG
jgi:catechol 2,3-dioxygenase-like lactoylglutathione lyase family enzyme